MVELNNIVIGKDSRAVTLSCPGEFAPKAQEATVGTDHPLKVGIIHNAFNNNIERAIPAARYRVLVTP
jgi:hypothetical protein